MLTLIVGWVMNTLGGCFWMFFACWGLCNSSGWLTAAAGCYGNKNTLHLKKTIMHCFIQWELQSDYTDFRTYIVFLWEIVEEHPPISDEGRNKQINKCQMSRSRCTDTLSVLRYTLLIWPCGLHLPSGFWVFKHLDDRLRLGLELLQLCHDSAPLLPQGWNGTRTHI